MIKSNKLDTSIDGQLPNNLVAPPIFTEALYTKPSESSSQDLYMHCRMNLAADTFNITEPQLVELELSTVDALDKGASIRNPATRIGRPPYATHWSAPDHIFENYSGWRCCENKVRL